MRLLWPLTGRSGEMRAIEAAILTSDVGGIVICGAAGVGKSRIAREALSAAASRGYESRWAVGTTAARTIPLGAFTAWAQSGVTETVQLVHGVIESLTAASAGTPVVVAVDDVHLLDDLSTFVVEQIVQRGAAKVMLTVRDGELIPAAVQEIWRGGEFDRLDLAPLSLDAGFDQLNQTGRHDWIIDPPPESVLLFEPAIGHFLLDDVAVSAVRPGQTFSHTDSGSGEPGASDDLVTTVTSNTIYVDITC